MVAPVMARNRSLAKKSANPPTSSVVIRLRWRARDNRHPPDGDGCRLRYGNNLVTKLLYWTVLLSALLSVTLWLFVYRV
jgi:hypothetical protein